MEDSFGAQLRYAIQQLTSPAGGAALLLWLILLVATLASPKVKWLVLVLLMWVATLSFYVSEYKVLRLAFPLEQIRANGRPLGIALMVTLLIPAITSPRGWRLKILDWPIILFFLFQMVIAIRIATAGVTDRGIITLMVYPLMFVSLAWGLSKWVQNWNDAHNVLRAVMLTGTLFVLATLYQLILNRAAVVRGNRLLGATGNPQQAALLIAIALPVAGYFVARQAEHMFLRVVAGVTAGFLVIFLMWTGLRTGILMAGVGIALTFRARIGRLIGVAIFIGLLSLAVFQVYSESTMSVAGMFIRGDTRTRVWGALLDTFVSSPVFGDLSYGYGVGENSYLSAAANNGIAGLLPLGAFMLLTVWALIRIHHARRFLGPERPIADCLIGGMGALFVGAMFEGYLLGTMTYQVFAIYAYLALITFTLDAEKMARYQAEYGELAGYAQDDHLLPAGAGPHPAYAHEQYF